MIAPRFARGTKGRMFMYVGMLVFVGVVVYVFHGTQVQLDEVRRTAEKCQQQQESLSAQLQVIFEYKVRLEKSLQQEKADHRHTREEIQNQMDDEKRLREKESLEAMNKYSSLQQQYKLLQSQHEDLQDEFSKLSHSQLQAVEGKNRLESQVQAIQQELDQVQSLKEKEVESIKSQYMQVQTENERLEKQYKEMVDQSQQAADIANYLRKQNFQLDRENKDAKKSLQSCERKLENDVRPEAVGNVDAGGEAKVIPKPNVSSPRPNQDQQNQQNVLLEPDKFDKMSPPSSSTRGSQPDAQGKNSNVIPIPPPQGAQHDFDKALEAPTNNRNNVVAKPVSLKEEDVYQVKNSENLAQRELEAPKLHDTGAVEDQNGPFWRVPQYNMVPPGVVPAPHGYGYFHGQPQNYYQQQADNSINRQDIKREIGVQEHPRQQLRRKSVHAPLPVLRNSARNGSPNVAHVNHRAGNVHAGNSLLGQSFEFGNQFIKKEAHESENHLNQLHAPGGAGRSGNLQVDAPGQDAWHNVNYNLHVPKEESHQIDQPLPQESHEGAPQMGLPLEENHQIDQPHLEQQFGFARQDHGKLNIQRREARNEIHAADRDLQLEEAHNKQNEIPLRMNNQYQYNGDYDKENYGDNKEDADGQANGGVRWAAKKEEGEIPRVPQEDLQLDEGDEDDDDEDVDQIDYAERVNVGVKPKLLKKEVINPHGVRIQQMDKHDSVMVNPK